MFSTAYAHDLVLHLLNKDGSTLNLPTERTRRAAASLWKRQPWTLSSHPPRPRLLYTDNGGSTRSRVQAFNLRTRAGNSGASARGLERD